MNIKDTLLIVGKSALTRKQLREIFSDSYNLIEASSQEHGLFLFEQNVGCISAVIMDLGITETKEDSLIHKIHSLPGGQSMPVVMLVDRSMEGMEIKGYEYGASDVIFKPFNDIITYKRVQALIELSLHRHNLQELVDEQSDIIRATNETMVDVLSTVIEYRSVETGNHVLRIRQYTKILLSKLAEIYPEYGLTPEDIDSITSATSLHDIGKISIPDSILNKPGKLTKEEFDVIKTHTVRGSEILQFLRGVADQKYICYAYNICLYHHERWDGNGYPEGLVGDQIPICAQVAGVADVYDALTTDRVYKEAFPHLKAVNMILNGECGLFSPKILECFKYVEGKFNEIHDQFNDSHEMGESVALDLDVSAPEYKATKIDALQMVQAKYQALLHYSNATVIEADLDSGMYHVVFNPHPDFYFPTHKESFVDAVQNVMDITVHEDDRRDAREVAADLHDSLFVRGNRKFIDRYRMFNRSLGTYIPYKITSLSLKNSLPGKNSIISIFEPEYQEGETLPKTSKAALPDIKSIVTNEYFSSLVGSIIVCENNNDYKLLYGVDHLFGLVGYTPEEIHNLFNDNLMNLVHPDDRESLRQQIVEQSVSTTIFDLEYRLMAKDGSLVWILDKSRLVTDENGREYFCSSLLDNTKGRRLMEELHQELERNHLIVNQSNDVVFELDILTNHLWCSDKWYERFGNKPLSDNYTNNVFTNSHIHPDDMGKMREGLHKLLKGETRTQVDVRIINADGIYTWNQIRATSKCDSNGKLSKAIGVIVDIDDKVRAMDALQKKSELDALTGLFNKEATRRYVSDLMTRDTNGKCSAFLLMDLDNFKSVNDTYGHLFGDNLLIRTATEIRKYFRTNDVVGRIGGDEFVIYIHGLDSYETIHTRCQTIMTTLNEVYKEMTPDIKVSCSIGVAMIPAHGDNYVDLFNKADRALYQAKSQGKNTYAIFSDEVQLDLSMDKGLDLDRASVERSSGGSAEKGLLHFFFQTLYDSTNRLATIDALLAEVGRKINVSRVYIFESSEDFTELNNTFEWCNEGITPEIDNLQHMNYVDGAAVGYTELFNERGVFYSSDIGSLEKKYRDILEPQGIKSMLQCAFYDKGRFCGFVGFDECKIQRTWTQEQIDLLTLLSQAISLFLLKERGRTRRERATENLHNVLNNQEAWIYVIDPDTMEMKYINQQTKEMSDQMVKGAHCYSVFMGNNTVCAGCPAKKLSEKSNAEAVMYNELLGMKLQCCASEIQWDGERSCMITCHEIKG